MANLQAFYALFAIRNGFSRVRHNESAYGTLLARQGIAKGAGEGFTGNKEELTMRTLTHSWFPILCSLIAAVSLYDTALIVLFRDHMLLMEENPMGRWLLEVGHGDVEIFVRAKLAGTLTVVSVLTFLWRYHKRTALPVTTSVAAYQTGLLAYLTFA